jgi:hypothetical protein
VCENPLVAMSRRRSPSRTPAALTAVCVALLTLTPRSSVAQSADNPCDIRTTERIVAIGDVHGAYDPFVSILTKAGLIDARQRWSGGRAILVQTGDVLDRGAASRRVLDLIKRLEQEASRAGGRVYALLGNHEVMRMQGDLRYVSTGEYEAFRSGASEDLRKTVLERFIASAAADAKAANRPFDANAARAQFMREIPLGFIEMRQAFDASGDYGGWLRTHPVMVKINGIAFMHGGASEPVAALGCEGINSGVLRELSSAPPSPEQANASLSAGESGPLWYRGLAREPEDAFASTLDRILKSLGARAIVIGHTPMLPARVTSRFGGRVIAIDTGMLDGQFFPGGAASAVEWQGDSITAVYEDRRERVDAPALQPATQN